jgi:hypothetical protein
VTIESDFEAAARELLVEHLRSDGLRPQLSNDGVATDIGKITIDFRVEGLEASGNQMQMVFWAVVGGVRGVAPPLFELDLLGIGGDAHEALTEGVHVLVDSVIPVLRADHDRRSLPGGVNMMPVTSMTDGVSATWDLFTGSPSIGGEPRAAIVSAVDDLALAQGIVDSITDSLGVLRPHWFKLFLVRTDDGEWLGDMKIDGVPVGLVDSFQSPKWPAGGTLVVRQFGLYRPADRRPDADLLEALGPGEPVKDSPRGWWRRR